MLTALLLLAALNQPLADPPLADPPPAVTTALMLRCLPRQLFVDTLGASGGKPLFVGLTGATGGAALEVWHDTTQDAPEHWVAFITRPDGQACLLAQGHSLGYANPDPARPRPAPF